MPKRFNSHKYNGENAQNAKNLRRNMTEQERKLWYLFLKDYPVKFYRQRMIDNYIADFYCAKAKLAIELDGSQHYSDEGEEYDKRRTEVLESRGIKVLRFTNPQITNNFKEVCEVTDSEVKNRITSAMTDAFEVMAYTLDGKIIGYDFSKYISENNLSVTNEYMMIAGRALTDLRAGDILCAQNGRIKISAFYLYGKKTEFCGRSCACVMICSYSDDISVGNILIKNERR